MHWDSEHQPQFVLYPTCFGITLVIGKIVAKVRLLGSTAYQQCPESQDSFLFPEPKMEVS